MRRASGAAIDVMVDDDRDPDAPDRVSASRLAPVVAVDADATLDEVRALFTLHQVATAVVTAADGAAIGMLSARDALRGLDGPSRRAGELMSTGVLAVQVGTPLERAAAVMAYEGVAELLVIGERGQVLGVLSALDVARQFATNAGYLIAR